MVLYFHHSIPSSPKFPVKQSEKYTTREKNLQGNNLKATVGRTRLMERLTNPNLSQLGGKHTKVQVKVRAHMDNLSSVKGTLGRARGVST